MTTIALQPTPEVAPERFGPGQALRHALVLAGRSARHYLRTPQVLIFVAFQPLMLVLLFNYVFGGAIKDPGVDYVQYLIPGVIVQSLAFSSSFAGAGITMELASGTLDRLRSLPIARSAVVLGRMLTDAVRMAFTTLVVVAAGMLVGFRFEAGLVPAAGALLLAVAFGWAFSWIGVAVGLALRNPEAVQVSAFVWLFPLVFASSAYVPVATMPGWLQAFVKANPISIVAQALRALTVGGPTTADLAQAAAWLLGITLVFAYLTVRLYRRLR
jgi:ABC transporter DrrB family efflux protein